MNDREADARPARCISPRLQAIWENMGTTERWMALEEEKAREAERKEEKLRLRLSEDEEILFMAKRSPLADWPIALLSLIFFVSSALIPEGGPRVASFTCLVLGLGGLAFLSGVKGRTVLYLTNFRVLVRRKTASRKRTQWSQVHYPHVRSLLLKKGFGRGGLSLEGEGESIEVRGLARADLETAARILGEKLPKKPSSPPQDRTPSRLPAPSRISCSRLDERSG